MEKVGAESHMHQNLKQSKTANRSEYIESLRKSSDNFIDNDF